MKTHRYFWLTKILLSFIYSNVVSNSITADWTNLMLCHHFKILTTLPTHTFMTTWRHGCVPWCLQTNHAFIRVLLLLRYFEDFNNKLLILQRGVLIRYLNLWQSYIMIIISLSIQNQSLLQFLMLLAQVLRCNHLLIWALILINRYHLIWIIDLNYLLNVLESTVMCLLLLSLKVLTTCLQLLINFEE